MNARDQERLTLVENSTWRQTALPAGRIALARGATLFLLLLALYWMLVPVGPETEPTAQLIASHWTPGSTPATAPAIQSGLLDLLALLLPVAFAAKFLELFQAAFAFAILVCWMRQLDAARSTVIPTALILGLSPGVCQWVIEGGTTPLLFLFGTALVATTDQVRAEAGRGVFFVGLFFGISVAFGPAMLPVLIYSLATLVFDRGIRGVRSRGCAAFLCGLIFGVTSALFLGHELHGETTATASWQAFRDPWLASLQSFSTPSIEVLTQSTWKWGGLAALFVIPGLIWALFRRPGDVALLLILITSGAFAASTGNPADSPLLSPSQTDLFTIFSALPAVIFCSWTLTLAHRSLARFQPTKKLLVTATSFLICIAAPLLIKPPLWKPSSELVHQWGRSVLETLPRGSLLVTGGGDQGIALEAIHWLDEIRPDVTILDPHGIILPSRIGLPADSRAESVREVIEDLRSHQRPLVFLPEGLSHPLATGWQVQSAGLWFAIRKQSQPIQSDLEMWKKIDLRHLPQSPQAAWLWLRGEGSEPPRRGRLAGKIAAESWFALARSQNDLRFDGRWAPILALLEGLHRDAEEVQFWIRQQGEELPRVSPAGRTRD